MSFSCCSHEGLWGWSSFFVRSPSKGDVQEEAALHVSRPVWNAPFVAIVLPWNKRCWASLFLDGGLWPMDWWKSTVLPMSPRSPLNSNSLIPKTLKWCPPKPWCELTQPHHNPVLMQSVSMCRRVKTFWSVLSPCFSSMCASFSSHTAVILKGLLGSEENWESLDDMQRIFSFRITLMSGRVQPCHYFHYSAAH